MSILGLDIGTHAVKAVLLRRSLFGTKIVDTAWRSTAGRSPEEVADELAQAWQERYDTLVFSLDRRHLTAREIQLPFRDPAQIDQAFPYAAEGRIPIPLHEALIDYKIEEIKADGGSRVMVLAFPKDQYEKRASLFAARTDEEPMHHVDAFANVNALLESQGSTFKADEVVGVLDVGATKSCLDLLVRGATAFTRTFLTAGDQVTRAIAREMSVEADKAEQIKIEGLVVGATESATEPDVRGLPSNLVRAITPVYTQLAQDVQHSLRAFHETHPGRRLALLYLSGGSAQSPFLKDFLADHLGVEVRLLSPPDLETAGGPGALAFTSAYGLALWGAGIGSVGLQLIRRRTTPLLLRAANIALLGVACLLLIAFHYYSLIQQQTSLGKRMEAIDARIAQELASITRPPLPPLPKNPDLKGIQDASTQTREKLKLLAVDEPSALAILERLNAILPASQRSQIEVNRLLIQGGSVQIFGQADSYEAVDDIKLSLERTKAFADVTQGPLSNQRLMGPKRLRFQINFRIREKEGEG